MPITHTITSITYVAGFSDVVVEVSRVVTGSALPSVRSRVVLPGLNNNPSFTDADTIAAYIAAQAVPTTDTVAMQVAPVVAPVTA